MSSVVHEWDKLDKKYLAEGVTWFGCSRCSVIKVENTKEPTHFLVRENAFRVRHAAEPPCQALLG